MLWDSAAPGLGLRARPNGRKTWIVHRRCNGSVVKRTLDALTVEDARHAARVLLTDAEDSRAPAAVPTVRTVSVSFVVGHVLTDPSSDGSLPSLALSGIPFQLEAGTHDYSIVYEASCRL